MKIILETDRLYLRELTLDDFNNLRETLQDEEAMYAYEHAFNDDEVHEWLVKQMNRYAKDGFGLWGIIRKTDQKFIGQCGLTMQDIRNNQVIEIGYLLNRLYWHHGYAQECAMACRDYAFDQLRFEKVYSIIRDTNLASIQVALRSGMSQIDNFTKFYYGVEMPHNIYCIENKKR